MPLTQDERDRIASRMRTLDYMEEEGIIKRTKRTITARDTYIIVGLGGTGCIALAELKKKMKRKVSAASIKQKVRFLAIDAATNELDNYQHRNVFEDDEILRLEPNGAANAVANPDEFAARWQHPDLGKYVQDAFDGNGAGARRQFGRALLTRGMNVSALQTAVQSKATQLVSGAYHTRCNLIILAGLAGGTGSGTVVDATYILRKIINPIAVNGTKTYGFLFLPPASSDKEQDTSKVLKGNANGYAALKEIEYHMTLSARDEHFRMQYTNTFEAYDTDIFDHCFLMDGLTATVFHEKHRTVATNTAADCIINMIAAEATNGPVAHADVLSYLPDKLAKLEGFIAASSPSKIPRDTYYHYSLAGYSECSIPADLLKIYAAKKVFDKLYEQYKNCDRVDADDAREFLSQFHLVQPEALRDDLRKKEEHTLSLNQQVITDDVANAENLLRRDLVIQLRDALDSAFLDESRGPYYVCNLTYYMEEAFRDVAVTTGNNHRQRMEYQAVSRIIEGVRSRMREKNGSVYDVFTGVIEEFKKILDSTGAVLCETDESKTPYGNRSYSWTPLQYGEQAGLKFLDELMNPEKINELGLRFMSELLAETETLTGTGEDKLFDPAKAIRDVVTKTFDDVFSLSMEDFAAICYSGRTDARALQEITDPDTGKTEQVATEELKAAADHIARELGNKAGVLAQLRDESVYQGVNQMSILVLPQETSHLNTLIKNRLPGADVLYSKDSDSITLFNVFLSIPLFEFVWTLSGEKAYAKLNGDVGQHMDQNQMQWRNFPNLINADLWDGFERGYKFSEEAQLAEHVREMMKRAQALGLTESYRKGSSDPLDYRVYVLPDDETTALGQAHQSLNPRENTDPVMKSQVDAAYEAEAERLFALLDKGDTSGSPETWQTLDAAALRDLLPDETFIAKETKPYPDCKMNNNVPVPKGGWEWEFTCKFMRKMYSACLSLQRTLGVMEALGKLAEAYNEGVRKAVRDSQHRRLFPRYYGCGLVDFDENGESPAWVFENVSGSQDFLLELVELDGWLKKYSYFYVRQRFNAQPDEVFDYWAARYEELMRSTAGSSKARNDQLKTNLESVLASLKSAQTKNSLTKSTGDPKLADQLREFYDNELSLYSEE